MKERVQYRPWPQDEPVATRFDQNVEFDCRGLSAQGDSGLGLLARAARRVEDASAARYEENAARGRTGFAHVLAALSRDAHASAEKFEPRPLS